MPGVLGTFLRATF